jgi:hypothetical protein
MPTDPKWRTISRISGASISEVIAVYVHVLVNASNATERGRTQSLQAEDLSSALDLDEAKISKILEVMQGRVLDGDKVSGWEKRQPAREDGSAARAKAWREAQKEKDERSRTQPNAEERSDTDTDTEKNNKKTLSVKKFTDEDLAMANEFWEMLFAENPENKKPNLNSWADDIRLMRERDNRTPHQIRWLWHWARGDPFWSTNIRAPEKLRKQFDTLVDKVKKQQSEKRNAKPANQPKFENDSLDWAKDFLGESDGGGCGVGEPTLRAVASDFPRLEAGIRSGREGIPGDQAPMDARFYGAGN